MRHSSNLSSKIEVFISARNLKDKDLKAFCVIFMQHHKGYFFELGRTSKVKKNLNPNWSESFLIDYLFEEEQKIRFEVFDYHKNELVRLGDNSTTIGELVGRGTSIFPLHDEGSLVVRVQDINGLNYCELKWFSKL